jgi:hypothetical protein
MCRQHVTPGKGFQQRDILQIFHDSWGVLDYVKEAGTEGPPLKVKKRGE